MPKNCPTVATIAHELLDLEMKIASQRTGQSVFDIPLQSTNFPAEKSKTRGLRVIKFYRIEYLVCTTAMVLTLNMGVRTAEPALPNSNELII